MGTQAHPGLRRGASGAARTGSSPSIEGRPAPAIVVSNTGRATRSPLDEIEDIVLEFAAETAPVQDARERAHRRALALTRSTRPAILSERIARIGFTADMVAALAPTLAHPDADLRPLIDRLDESASVPRWLLGREVLRAPQLIRLAPSHAIEVALALVLAFAKARAAALWAREPAGELVMLAGAGDVEGMPAEWTQIAGSIINGEVVAAPENGEIAATAVRRSRSEPAVLLVFGEDALSPERRLLIEAAEPLLTLALERQQPVGGPPPASGDPDTRPDDALDRDALAAATRRLTRLRFDLHDGPQQDALMLVDDLREFRDRLDGELRTHSARDLLVGGVDDLHARLVALDGDLRRLSASVQSPFLQPSALPQALSRIADAFAKRSGIEPTLEMSGDLAHLSDSQQIALLALIREALSNVREHSEATHVSILIRADDDGLTASVADNGRGFDPDVALVKAAREGHLGLVGMHERVRMLGGRTQISSNPGGPTVISVSLPVVGAPRQDDARGSGSSRGTRRA